MSNRKQSAFFFYFSRLFLSALLYYTLVLKGIKAFRPAAYAVAFALLKDIIYYKREPAKPQGSPRRGG